MLLPKIEFIIPKFRYIKHCGKSRKSRRKFFRKIWVEFINLLGADR